MARWTEAELAALRVAGRDYRRFVDLTGGSKSYDAFEVKSRRVALGVPRRSSALARALRWLADRADA